MIVSAYSFLLIIFCIAKPRMLREPFLTRIQAHVASGVAGLVGRHVMIWAGEDYRFGWPEVSGTCFLFIGTSSNWEMMQDFMMFYLSGYSVLQNNVSTNRLTEVQKKWPTSLPPHLVLPQLILEGEGCMFESLRQPGFEPITQITNVRHAFSMSN